MTAVLPSSIESMSPDEQRALLQRLLARRASSAPASFAQEALYTIHEANPSSAAYNFVFAARVQGDLDATALEASLRVLVERNVVLRTAFAVREGTVHQRVASPEAFDFRAISFTERSREAMDEAVRHEAQRPFDLGRAPLFRTRVLSRSADDHVLLLVFHHTVIDAWSITLLLRDLGETYAACRAGATPAPPPKEPVAKRYADYAVGQRRELDGPQGELLEAYWRDALAGAPTTLELPIDFARPPVQSLTGDAVAFELAPELSAALTTLSRAANATLYTTLFTVFALLVHAYTGEDDFLIGTPTSGRTHAEWESILGYFVNPVCVRANLSGNPSVLSLIERLRARHLETFEHQDYPFAKVVKALRPDRDPSRAPLVQVLFGFQKAFVLPELTPFFTPGAGDAPFDLGGLRLVPFVLTQQAGQVDLALDMTAHGDRIYGCFKYDGALFRRETVARLADDFVRIAAAVAAEPAIRVGALRWTEESDAAERSRADAEDDVWRRFEARAQAHPDAVAIVAGETTWRYGELAASASRLAQRLVRRGVGPESRVAVCASRSVETIIALFAVLRAGASYVPLDPSTPQERLAWLLNDAAVSLVITEKSLAGRMPGLPTLVLDRPADGEETGLADGWGAPAVHPDQLAYVLYTSGSTGTPKGVGVSRGALASFLRAMGERLPLRMGDVVVATTTLTFDIAVLELFLPLVHGARVALAHSEDVQEPARLAALVENASATHVQCTPSAWRMLLDSGWRGDPARLTLLSGGEALSPALAEALLARGRAVWNLYGPTEATVWATAAELRGGAAEVPVGAPLANTRLYVLDRHLRRVPRGAIGEVYIGGDALARGYVGRPDLTADRFVPDPFFADADGRGARMYRTGDRARVAASGELELLGRTDHQVKVRGYRVEPAEIEARLATHPAVRQALVVAREDVPGDKRLVAYVVAENPLDAGALRRHLAAVLPEYMVPSAFVRLPSLPLMSSGKIDRKALPAPYAEEDDSGYVPPRGEIEQTLCTIWERVLRRPRIGVHDNFFELGGDSILRVRVASAMRDAGVAIAPRLVFLHQTIAELAAAIGKPTAPDGGASSTEAIDSAVAQRAIALDADAGSIVAILPTTPLQQGMIFHTLRDPGSDAYIQQVSFVLAADREPLADAWRALAASHAAMRTSFRWEGVDAPVQIVRTAPRWTVAREKAPPELATWLADERTRARDFDVPMRVALLDDESGRTRVVWTFHHALLDGWSTAALLGEWLERVDGVARTPAETVSVEPYFAWLRRRQSDAEVEGFWKRVLHALDDGKIARSPRRRGGSPGRLGFALSAEATARIAAFARAQRTTPSIVAQAAWAILMARHTGSNDVVFGITTSGRAAPVPGLDRMIGLFIRTLPARVRLDHALTVGGLLRALAEHGAEAEAHDTASLPQLHAWAGRAANEPLFESLFVFENYPIDRALAEARGRRLSDVLVFERSEVPLSITLSQGDELTFLLAHDATLGRDQVNAIGEQYQALLERITFDADARVRSVSSLTDDERTRLLALGTGPTLDLSPDRIERCFERRARMHPERAAVVADDGELTYAALDTRASALARELCARGIREGSLVGICVERSAAMLVAMLAVLKAGAAYVPLDTTYPADRLRFMVEDSRAEIVLTSAGAQAALADWCTVPALRADVETFAQDETAPFGTPAAPVSPLGAAYAIYTSGSTGRPKGVVVPHATVTGFFAAMDTALGRREAGTWLALTSISFDISVLELLWTVTRGWTVVVHDPRAERVAPSVAKPTLFSLFFFANDESAAGDDKYRLLLESAKLGDANGFTAVWTPERHFHSFGGIYPNPSVLAAAVAATTTRIGIRAGSVVLPLHDPVRVAEEWSVVDNLSRGRVGLSFASGWHANDFVLAPEEHARRHEAMVERVDVVRRLWRGEAIARRNGAGEAIDVRTHPRPVQPELPFWVTAAGSPETFALAGRLGARLLTHLLGQNADALAAKLRIYRDAWRAAGHADDGHVSLMLHTFVDPCPDVVLSKVRGPFREYLRSSADLVRGVAATLDASIDVRAVSASDMEAVLDHAFDRYFRTAGLFGTPAECVATVRRLHGLGIDEIACLVDFGIDADSVLAGLRHLTVVMNEVQRPVAAPMAARITSRGVTHVQCTPSGARAMLLDPESSAALANVETMLVGGEALPGPLAEELKRVCGGAVLNMYGPTETTIWSSFHAVTADDREGVVPLGKPLANTHFYVTDEDGALCATGVPGELCIGGDMVARGYLGRPDVTAARFVPDPFGAEPGRRMYRTGDRVRWTPEGTLAFLGRLDHQVKLRGHRIELGEIESALAAHPSVAEALVVAREDALGDVRLVAYVAAKEGDPRSADGDRALREHLVARLPEAMIPSSFVRVPALPRTPNGKIDRRSLPAPQSMGEGGGPDAAPQGALETTLATLWAEALGVPRVGADAHLFEQLGGNSLLALKLASRMGAALGRSIPVAMLYEHVTVQAMATALAAHAAHAPPLVASAGHEAREDDRSVRRRRMYRRLKQDADT